MEQDCVAPPFGRRSASASMSLYGVLNVIIIESKHTESSLPSVAPPVPQVVTQNDMDPNGSRTQLLQNTSYQEIDIWYLIDLPLV